MSVKEYLYRDNLLALRQLMVDIADVPVVKAATRLLVIDYQTMMAKAGASKPEAFAMKYCFSETECGTAACAGGWAIWAGLVPKYAAGLPHSSLGRIVFTADDGCDFSPRQIILLWLFGAFWADAAPTPMDVVVRIDYLLSGDKAVREIVDCNDRYALVALWEEISNV